MILNTRFSKYLLCVLIFFGFSMVIFIKSSPDQLNWFGSVFSQGFYVYQLASIFLFGIFLIDQHYGTSFIVRMESREKATYEEIIFKYMFAFIYLNIWFMLIVLLTTYLFEAPFLYDISYILNRYVHYLLGFLIIINLAGIFKRSTISTLRFSPIPLAYLIMVVEVTVITTFILTTNLIHINFVFGWIFNEGIISYLALIIAFVISLFYLIKFSAKKDII